MKVNEYDLLYVQSYKAHEIFRLKGKTYKMITIFGVFLIRRLMQGDMTAEKKKKNVCLKAANISFKPR